MQPYVGRVRSESAQLAALERELGAHKKALQDIRRYELRKADLEELIDIVNATKEAQLRELTPTASPTPR